MVQYIYFVKCPNCEDEHFDFFDEAKEFALGCLSKKPVITQTEVNRNDFGECTDHCDLGTIWSWEDTMGKVEDEPAVSVFTKDDLKTLDNDPEFDDDDFFAINNSEESVDTLAELFDANIDLGLDGGDNNNVRVLSSYNPKEVDEMELDELFDANVSLGLDGGTGNNVSVLSPPGLGEACSRKPIPEGMTIEQLVEEMEENEDEVECVCCQELHPKEDCQHDDKHGWICDDCKDEVVECTWCEELYDRSECRYEVNLGWLCDRCEAAIKSRGETLTFREGSYWDFLDEDMELKKMETLVYDKLTVPVQTGYVPATREEPEEYITKDYTDSFEYSVPVNNVATTIFENFLTDEEYYELAESEDNDKLAWKNLLDRYDEFVEKHYDELLDYYREDAEEAAKDDFQDRYDDRGFDEGLTKKSMLEELEDPDTYRFRLADCPECGAARSYDHETGICIGCGFNFN